MTKDLQYKKAEFKRATSRFIGESHKWVTMAVGEMEIFDKASIEFPTATGKTRVIQCDLLKHLPDKNPDVFCIASHRLMLNVQHIKGLMDILKFALPDVAFVFVGSATIGFADITQSDESLQEEIAGVLYEYNNGLDDSEKVQPKELVNQTCSTKELGSIIENHKNKGRDVIVISTYHSLDKLQGIPLHTIYCDEAHMIAGPRQNEFFKAFNSLSFERSYFFTGTPKEAIRKDRSEKTKELIESEEEETARAWETALMNNKEIFGERVRLSIKEAIDDTLVVQPIWHILYPDDMGTVDRSKDLSSRAKMVKQCFQSHEKWLYDITADEDKIAPKLLINCKGVEDIWKLEEEIRKSFSEYNDKKIRIFAIASAGSEEDDSANMLIDGNPIYSRIDFLSQLNGLGNTEYAIVFHFNVLTEGIDVPSMTGVVFMTQGLPTIIKTLQTIGRATRLHPEDRKRLFGYGGVSGNDRMSLADRDTKWIKPYCAVMVPVLGDETHTMSDRMKAMIPELADSIDFENKLVLTIGEDTAIGKRVFENPNDTRTGLDKIKSKALFDIKEIREEIQNTRDIKAELRRREEVAKVFEKFDNIDEEEQIKYLNGLIKSGKKVKRLYGFDRKCNFTEKVGTLQTVHTPDEIIERMIEISKPEIDDKILVLFNIEFVVALRNRGYKNITYFSDSKKMANLVEKMYINIETIYIKDLKKIKNDLNNMKFDLIISNPPYNQNLHLRMLDNILELSKNICFVQPAEWLYDNREYLSQVKKTINILKEKIAKRVHNINIIDGDTVFNANTGPCVIMYITYTHNNGFININDEVIDEKYTVDNINSIDVHGFSDIYRSIFRKMHTYNNKLINNLKSGVSYERLNINGHTGLGAKHQYFLIRKSFNTNFNYHRNPANFTDGLHFNEENIISQKNIFTYIQLKIVRFALSINHIGRHLFYGNLDSIPYMPTYTHPWTDEDVAKELGLTEEELAWAINWIPDYYPEDAEKYAKWKI